MMTVSLPSSPQRLTVALAFVVVSSLAPVAVAEEEPPLEPLRLQMTSETSSFVSTNALGRRSNRHARLDKIRGFGGLVLGGGPTVHAYQAPGGGDLLGPDTFGGVLIALKAGVLLHAVEIMVEWAPGTFRPILDDESRRVDAGEWFYSLLGSAGYYLPITEGVYWPMRLGAGVGSERNDMIVRLDLVNVAVKTRYVLLDFSFPSIRYMTDFDRYHRWMGLFTVGGSYVYP